MIILHKKVQFGMGEVEREVMYYMELNKNGAGGDKQTKNMN